MVLLNYSYIETLPGSSSENKIIAKKGEAVAGNARKDLEKKLGNSVISPLNVKSLKNKDDNELDE